jgi:hypothetical protein
MAWHNAFVFRPEDSQVDVYEIYHMQDGIARTQEPVLTLYGEDVEDLSVGLQQMYLDLTKGRYFESEEKMDQHYGMGGDDID